MKRTTVFLDEPLIRRLKQKARAEGKSFAQVVREAVSAYVASPRTGKRPLSSIIGKYSSGYTDTSERFEELLWQDPHD